MKKTPRIRSTYPEAKAQKKAVREAAAAYGIAVDVVTVREARDRLSGLLDRAEQGRTIVITSDGKPKAMVVRYRPMITGTGWTSHRDLRAKTSIVEDSAPLVRAERDRSY